MRLFLICILVWTPPLTSALWFDNPYAVSISALSLTFFLFIFMSFFISTLLFSGFRFRYRLAEKLSVKIDDDKLQTLFVRMTGFWLLIYLGEVTLSGGLPAFWGGARGYESFGVPVVHGFSNALRGINVSIFLILIYLRLKPSGLGVLILILSIVSALILEQSRGAFVMTIAYGVGIVLLFQEMNLRFFVTMSVVGGVIIILFSSFQFIRYSNAPLEEASKIAASLLDEGSDIDLVAPVANYIATPAMNAGLNIDNARLIDFQPNETLKPLIPSVLREAIFGNEKSYGLLIDDAFNTTSFVTPFIRDFGYLGAIAILSLFFVHASFIYASALRGSLTALFAVGPLGMVVFLSFFNSYLTSLVFFISLIVSPILASEIKARPALIQGESV